MVGAPGTASMYCSLELEPIWPMTCWALWISYHLVVSLKFDMVEHENTIGSVRIGASAARLCRAGPVPDRHGIESVHPRGLIVSVISGSDSLRHEALLLLSTRKHGYRSIEGVLDTRAESTASPMAFGSVIRMAS